MDTSRVNICYRPLRIAWAIRSDDRASFAHAVSTSHTMWGGRFNPIVMVDRHEAADLVELFRADMIMPLGDSPELEAFSKRFPHIIYPFFEKELFFRDPGTSHAQVLDIHNALVHWREMPEWKGLVERGIRRFRWEADDPLAGVFNIQYGTYPNPDDVDVDYWRFITGAFPQVATAAVTWFREIAVRWPGSATPNIDRPPRATVNAVVLRCYVQSLTRAHRSGSAISCCRRTPSTRRRPQRQLRRADPGKAMPRIARPRVQEEGHRPAAEKRFVSRKNAAAEPLDDVERKFLEPVARYLAILQEWSLERLSDGTGTVPPSEQP